MGRLTPVQNESGRHVTAERLEGRRLFSADLAAAYGAAPPVAFPPGERQRIAVRVTNAGDATAAGARVQLFASADASPGADDVLLATTNRAKPLKPGKAARLELKFTPPTSLPDGNYRLLARVTDAAGAADADTANDVAVSPSAVSIQRPFVDLGVAVSDQPGGPVSTVGWAGRGTEVKVTAAVFNNGNVIADAPTSVALYLSADATLDPADVPLAASPPASLRIKPGGAKPVCLRFRLPAGTAAGDYRLIAVVDPSGTVAESDEANNTAVSAAALTVVNVPVGPPPSHYHWHYHYPGYYVGGGYYPYDDYYYDDPGGSVDSGSYADDGGTGIYVPPADDGGLVLYPPDEPALSPPPAAPPMTQPADEPAAGGSDADDFDSGGSDFGGYSDPGPAANDWSGGGNDW